ncbi:alpha/beta hydrolase [Cetobacterium sp. 8H]|uniref:alpha/beta hydrolase n=1 Tax=Cetobacterium sp. 8H TaxID=2759681 RepID=UPI00163C4E9D|nr:alpha/beta hydrolase [Cetobacterium sp. 8H]MBC2852187.1 alpha/beta hydrolase [Cetobacterium sp. 8H]
MKIKNKIIKTSLFIFAFGLNLQANEMPKDWKGPVIQGPPSGEGMLGKGPTRENIKNKFIDLPYATKSQRQKLDLYLPNSGNKPYPLIIHIHGGAFFGGNKYDEQLFPMFSGLDRGYAVASINYRLSPEAKWPAQINDVKAAIKYLKVNADKYNINPDKIVLWGGSAGGHLSALAGVTPTIKELEDPSLGNPDITPSVAAVVDWFGPIDFLAMDEQWKILGINGEKHSTPDSFESFLMREQITKVPELVSTSNPENYITKDAPVFFIQHGTSDKIIPALQGKNFADKLISVIGKNSVFFEFLEGANHGHEEKMFSTPENIDKVFKFLEIHLDKIN